MMIGNTYNMLNIQSDEMTDLHFVLPKVIFSFRKWHTSNLKDQSLIIYEMKFHIIHSNELIQFRPFI